MKLGWWKGRWLFSVKSLLVIAWIQLISIPSTLDVRELIFSCEYPFGKDHSQAIVSAANYDVENIRIILKWQSDIVKDELNKVEKMFKLRTLSEKSVFAKISTDGLCVSIKRKCFTHVVVWVRQLPHYSKILRIADKLTIITIVRYISKLAFSLSVNDTKIVFLNHFRILSLPSPAHAVLESIWFCPIPRCSLPISSIAR